MAAVLFRSPEGAAPFKVSQTSRGAGRTTAYFNTSQRLERGASVLRIYAAQQQKKTLCDALEGYKQPVKTCRGCLLAKAAACTIFLFFLF